jgi:hypothetical protein
MKRLLTIVALAATLTTTAALTSAAPATAQLDPGTKTLWQLDRGKWSQRGQIFVPIKDDRDHYLEHWILYPGYTYPSQSVDVTMRFAAAAPTPSEQEFLAQKFPDGARYVLVEAHEYAAVPSAPPTAP